jgi:hypothetical protein
MAAGIGSVNIQKKEWGNGSLLFRSEEIEKTPTERVRITDVIQTNDQQNTTRLSCSLPLDL